MNLLRCAEIKSKVSRTQARPFMIKRLIPLTIVVAAPLGASAADFEVKEALFPDHLTCLEMAREEARYIVEISALHPAAKHEPHGDVAIQVDALKQRKQEVHRQRRMAKCI
jgi:hypothetical protein